jgi:hypothetical protein
MKRLALLGAAVLGLVTGAAACGSSPVQPGSPIAAADIEASYGKKKGSTPTVASCENLVYPYTLCASTYRPALCEALNNGGTIERIPYGSRMITATFVRLADGAGAQETAITYLPYYPAYPPSSITLPVIAQAQIDSPGLCPRT